jgi:hypothetical protein
VRIGGRRRTKGIIFPLSFDSLLVYEVTTILMSHEYNTTTALLSIVPLGALVSIEYGLAQLSKDEDLSEYGLAQLSKVEDFCE